MSAKWTASRLGDHLREPIRNGYSPGSPDRPTGKWQLTLAALTPSGFDPSGVKYAPANDLRLDQSLLSPGDLLVSRSNTPDRVGLAGIYSGDPTPCSYPDLMMKVKLRDSLDASFCVHLLLSSAGRRYFSENARGSSGSMVKIDRSILQAFPLRLPSPSEQKAVTRVLADADSLLASLESLLVKKRNLRQAAMQQLLTGKIRLPSFDVPWRTAALGTLFAFNGGFSASREQLSSSGHCYLHYGDIHLSTKLYVDVCAEADQIPRLDINLREVGQASLLRDGDVVFVDASEDDEGASKHIVVENAGNLPYISGLHTIVAKSRGDHLEKLFKRYCFQSRRVKEQFKFYAVGTKVSGISKSNIAKIELTFPNSREEQRAIATVLSDMDMELALVTEQRDKLLALKQAMMQQLLTGRIRLI